MTLNEWAEVYNVAVKQNHNGATFVTLSTEQMGNSRCRWDIHHLSDYLVSSVSGPVRYLLRKGSTYTLTLTHGERKAIDWVGYRYRHGEELYKLLWCECELVGTEGDECTPQWDGDSDLDWDSHLSFTFSVPESVAWQIVSIVNDRDERLTCFSEELVSKLRGFADSVV